MYVLKYILYSYIIFSISTSEWSWDKCALEECGFVKESSEYKWEDGWKFNENV